MNEQVHAGSAKAAIDAMTRHLAVEWGSKNIRINCIAPGPIEGTVGMRKLGENECYWILSFHSGVTITFLVCCDRICAWLVTAYVVISSLLSFLSVFDGCFLGRGRKHNVAYI